MRPFRFSAAPDPGGGACATATVPPPPTPALLRVAVTDLTEPLLLDLAAAYAEANPAVALAPTWRAKLIWPACCKRARPTWR